ncbi:MAG TPA: glycosyltransferase family A protein [Thermomicrobiales bacterium]|nr:glycosyltransferase family A protein [Thermomicrobiales bacterium]
MSDSTVSLVIRCFNEEAHLGRLLRGVARQTRRPDQIVIVDSGSTDSTLEIAAAFDTEIHHVDPARFSFGRSLNIGCRASKGDLIVIASAHVYPLYDSWLAELTAPFDDREVVLSYGRQEGGSDTRYSEKRVMARWFPPTSAARQDHPFCNNANAAVRRSAWEQQPYDEELTGLEDLDWAKRQMDAGRAIAYVATAPVVHAHDETWSQLVNRYRREAIGHKRIFHERGMSGFEAMRLAAGNVASDYVHATREGELLSNIGAIPSFRIAQFWGTYLGFRHRGDASAALRRRFYYPHGWRRQPTSEQPHGAQRIDYEDRDHRGVDVRAD